MYKVGFIFPLGQYQRDDGPHHLIGISSAVQELHMNTHNVTEDYHYSCS